MVRYKLISCLFFFLAVIFLSGFEYVPPAGDKLPSLVGEAGKVLFTDGSTYFWDTPSGGVSKAYVDGTDESIISSLANHTAEVTAHGIPSQGTHNGKFLSTNGSTMSWQTVSSGGITSIYDTDDTLPSTGPAITIQGGTGATVTRTGDTFEISATGTGTFNRVYANTDGTYSDGPALTFKNGSNVSITRSGDTIEIASTASAGGYSAEWTSVSTVPTRVGDGTFEVTDNTANAGIFVPGRPIKFTISSTTYYAYVRATVDEGTTLEIGILGAPYTASPSAFAYGTMNRLKQVNFNIQGYFATATDPNLLASHNRMYYNWELGDAAVCAVKLRCIDEDSGANEPYVTLTLGGTSVLSTNTNKGLSPTSSDWVSSTVSDIRTAYYSTSNSANSVWEVAVDASGTNTDSRDLSVCVMVVLK